MAANIAQLKYARNYFFYSFFNTDSSGTETSGGELDGGYIGFNQLSVGNFNISQGTGVAIQNEAGTATDFEVGQIFDVGINNDDQVNNAEFTFGPGTASAFRVGILVGVRENVTGGTNPLDIPQAVGISGTTQNTIVLDALQADWYFFNVENVADGDSITVSANRISDTNKHKLNPISGVVFAPVPEPANATLAMGAALAALALVRRRRV